MNTSDMVDVLVEAYEGRLKKKNAREMLVGVFDTIRSALESGDKVSIKGFGTFAVKVRPAREAREGINPFTGEATVFEARPATKVVKFRPAKALKDAVAQQK